MAVQLDADQSRAVRDVMSGVNVAAVGPAGCGKSETLKMVVRLGKERWGDKGVVVLAWSGSAANLVDGKTLSSLLRVTVGDPSKERILSRLMEPRNSALWKAILDVRLVVIDEAPTIEGRWFDRLEYVFRMAASVFNQCRPFGARVVFAAGDPLQMPAYGVTDESLEVSAYCSRSWADTFSSCYGETVRLSGQHRQCAADGLRELLDRMRLGKTADADITALNRTWGADPNEKWLEFSHLRATNKDAAEHNNFMMGNLPTEPLTFQCTDTMKVTSPDQVKNALKKLDVLAPRSTIVCVDATVVLTRTVSPLLTAGSHGRVVAVEPGVSVTVCFFEHKTTVTLGKQVFCVKDAMERTLAERCQIPVLLAWAITVSRAQGMTLRRVAIDFSCTEWTLDCLAYSAISRAVSLDCLRVKGLRRAHIRTCASGLRYYQQLALEERM